MYKIYMKKKEKKRKLYSEKFTVYFKHFSSFLDVSISEAKHVNNRILKYAAVV